MATFIMLTQISSEAVRSPRAIEILERQAMSALRAECPQVEWGKEMVRSLPEVSGLMAVQS